MREELEDEAPRDDQNVFEVCCVQPTDARAKWSVM